MNTFRTIGLLTCLALAWPYDASASCGRTRGPSVIAQTYIESCESFPDHRNLLVTGVSRELYELNRQLIPVETTGKTESWVLISDKEQRSCSDLVGKTIRTKLGRPCCDVIPSPHLACQKKLGLLFVVERDGDKVPYSSLHKIDRLFYFIGETTPFTGTYIYYLPQKDANVVHTYEQRIENGDYVAGTTHRYEDGTIKRTFIVMDDGNHETKEFDRTGALVKREVDFVNEAPAEPTLAKSGYIQKWENGNETCTYKRGEKPCEYHADGTVIE